jgi:hypothetical protein
MKRWLSGLAWVLVLGIGLQPARAQLGGGMGPGDLDQQVRRGMEMAMIDLENRSLGITEEAMEESIGEEQLQTFLEGAVVRLLLRPDGTCISKSMLGGELVSFTVGKEAFTLGEEWTLDENEWVERTGEFSVPKKPQKVSLTVKAGDQQVTAKCFNKYEASEGPITFYVGPLDGYFCMGLLENGG